MRSEYWTGERLFMEVTGISRPNTSSVIKWSFSGYQNLKTGWPFKTKHIFSFENGG
jgi:hypothetical protein